MARQINCSLEYLFSKNLEDTIANCYGKNVVNENYPSEDLKKVSPETKQIYLNYLYNLSYFIDNSFLDESFIPLRHICACMNSSYEKKLINMLKTYFTGAENIIAYPKVISVEHNIMIFNDKAVKKSEVKNAPDIYNIYYGGLLIKRGSTKEITINQLPPIDKNEQLSIYNLYKTLGNCITYMVNQMCMDNFDNLEYQYETNIEIPVEIRTIFEETIMKQINLIIELFYRQDTFTVVMDENNKIKLTRQKEKNIKI